MWRLPKQLKSFTMVLEFIRNRWPPHMHTVHSAVNMICICLMLYEWIEMAENINFIPESSIQMSCKWSKNSQQSAMTNAPTHSFNVFNVESIVWLVFYILIFWNIAKLSVWNSKRERIAERQDNFTSNSREHIQTVSPSVVNACVVIFLFFISTHTKLKLKLNYYRIEWAMFAPVSYFMHKN